MSGPDLIEDAIGRVQIPWTQRLSAGNAVLWGSIAPVFFAAQLLHWLGVATWWDTTIGTVGAISVAILVIAGVFLGVPLVVYILSRNLVAKPLAREVIRELHQLDS